jgi:phosphodiesterase/alkaline phosphatase D-like protein
MASTTVRFAQFNASLNRNAEGQLVNDLSNPAVADNRGFGVNTNQALRVQQAKNVAETIQRSNPDVLLINEFDFFAADPGKAVELFNQNFLNVSQNGATPVDYPYFYIAPSNTGISTGFDLNNNGAAVTAISNGIGAAGYGDDAFGFGNFPGQFGMVVLSKYPIDTANVRTFQNFLWKDMPGNLLTNDPTIDNPATAVNENLGSFYSPQEQAILRLSSKSHWDIPITINGEVVHALVSHPTPPVFDGTEDRNGKRNYDEIRFWSDYITPGEGGYIYDDKGDRGGITPGSSFVIMGDQNADPYDGDSYDRAVLQLLTNPYINTNSIPTSPGAQQQSTIQGAINQSHRGNPNFDTADFADTTPGNLRADYVLPSADLPILNSQVFWPLNTDSTFNVVGTFNGALPGGFPSSDHRSVYVDIQVGSTEPARTVSSSGFLGQQIFATGTVPTGAAGTIAGTAVPLGGLSGVTYDAVNNRYYSIADDRSQFGPARFYTFTADVSGTNPVVNFTNVTALKNASGNNFAPLTIDPEGIALTNRNTVFISSEGEANVEASRVAAPFVNEFDLVTGAQLRALPVSSKFTPVFQDLNGNGVISNTEQVSGIRNNLAFESLTISPNQKVLYTATENALVQDGPVASATTGSRSRIVQYNLVSGQAEKEYLYVTDAVAIAPTTATAFNTNGLVDLLAIDNRGTFLALERSFTAGAPGTGNTIKLFEVSLQGATDISFYNSLNSLTPAQFSDVQAVQKRLLLNLDSLKLPTGLDNVEGLTFGPKLADGRQSVLLVSDNNFSGTQFTQILTIGVDMTNSLPNGVASGDTTQTSTVLWTRSTFEGLVTFEYSTSPTFSTIAGTKTALVTDPTQPVKVNVTGLQPGTDYYYRVTDAAGATLNGQFETSAPIGTQAGLRFGVSGDWRGELAPYPAIANADERNLAFFVEHGDTIYADDASPAVVNPDGTAKQQVETLGEYRAKHAEVYNQRFGDNTWADLRASTSILATIDDHEVTNDFAGGELATSDPRFKDSTPGRLINDTALYEVGLQTFQEYNPLRDDFYGNTGDPRTAGERKLYRYNTYGSDAATFVVDTRSFRDAEIPGPVDFTNPQQVGAVIAKTFTPGRTLLGQVQFNDLKQDLLSAQRNGITWKFVMIPEPIQNIFPGINTDAYEGYNAERTELLKFITDNKLDNVVFVAADVHTTFVNNLTYQERAFGPQIATNVWEITTGAVAYERPTGEFLANIFTAGNPQLQAFYNSLPNAPDRDNIANDKDDFVKQLVNSQLLAPGGYDPLGLDNNLPQANGLIDAKLLQGDYFVGHSYSWSEFDINPISQKLTVTTYGIPSYTEAQLLANPAGITDQTPRILSQFEVNAKVAGTISGAAGNDNLFGTNGNDRIDGGAGDDSIYAGEGNNTLLGGAGNNTFYAGAGSDRITADDGNNIAYAGEGNNEILFGNGNNSIYSGAGNDNITSGNGNTSVYAGEGLNTITTGAGNDKLFVGAGNDIINAGNGRNEIYAGEGANTITTGTGDDLIFAGAGNDVITTDGGNDLVYAGEGNNSLNLGTGNDVVYAGYGADIYVLNTGVGSLEVRGWHGSDRIRLGSGVTASSLTFVKSNGDTLISQGSDLLATLKWVELNSVAIV